MSDNEDGVSISRKNVISIVEDGRSFRGYYIVHGGRLCVWALGADGSVEGPFSMSLFGTDREVAARMVLQDYINGLDGRRRTKRGIEYD